LHFFCIFFANLWHFRKKNVRKCPDFPPKFPEGTLLRRAVSVKIMFFRGRISRISRNCTNLSRGISGISGNFREFPEFRQNRSKKALFFLCIYKRLQPENQKNPRIFPRDFPEIFREFPGFPEIFRDFGKTQFSQFLEFLAIRWYNVNVKQSFESAFINCK